MVGLRYRCVLARSVRSNLWVRTAVGSGSRVAGRSLRFHRIRLSLRDPPFGASVSLRRSPWHPVMDIGVEHFAVSGERGFKLRLGLFFAMSGIKRVRGQDGLLTNLTAMMC